MTNLSMLSDARITAVILLALVVSSACGGYDSIEPLPAPPATITVTLGAPVIEVGEMTVASAAAVDQYGDPTSTVTVTWTSSDPTIAAVSPTTGAILGIAPGTARITGTTDGERTGAQIITVVRAPNVRINEIESSHGSSRLYVELVNPTRVAVDISGWTVTNKDVRQSFVFPAGSTIAPGGLLVVDETSLPFSLGANDAVRLFSRFGVLVDGLEWKDEAATTFGRCPTDASDFVTTTAPTKGTANACPATENTSQSGEVSRGIRATPTPSELR
ncbi:MAG TPA: lamin tail domain-containing protein [Gemmatimonadaceae bacterium]|nr:lamin tail domain-containing protein [Gemmatimonadaceae bacterium]